MANEEQLSILKQGVEVWNRWRKDNPNIQISFLEADLRETDLNGVNLCRAFLWRANLSENNLEYAAFINTDLRHTGFRNANLNRADFTAADLNFADLRSASLIQANLQETNLRGASLSEADLGGANLTSANLSGVDLRMANLRGAYLSATNLSGSELSGTVFSSAHIGDTNFGNLDLRNSIGLDEVEHSGPSTLGINTLVLSKGKIPEVFLRGCGLSDWEIEIAKLYDPNLNNEEINNIQYKMYDLRATQAIQVSPLFISYSHSDRLFVDKLESHLNKKGVRFWRDIHDATSGRLEKQIDRAIRQNPTVLLVLSEHSLSSDWVEHEVRTARGLEKEMVRDVLCPIALDDSWKSSRWPKRVMEYNILDFSEWQDNAKFDGMFRKLIDGLELFYKG